MVAARSLCFASLASMVLASCGAGPVTISLKASEPSRADDPVFDRYSLPHPSARVTVTAAFGEVGLQRGEVVAAVYDCQKGRGNNWLPLPAHAKGDIARWTAVSDEVVDLVFYYPVTPLAVSAAQPENDRNGLSSTCLVLLSGSQPISNVIRLSESDEMVGGLRL